MSPRLIAWVQARNAHLSVFRPFHSAAWVAMVQGYGEHGQTASATSPAAALEALEAELERSGELDKRAA